VRFAWPLAERSRTEIGSIVACREESSTPGAKETAVPCRETETEIAERFLGGGTGMRKCSRALHLRATIRNAVRKTRKSDRPPKIAKLAKPLPRQSISTHVERSQSKLCAIACSVLRFSGLTCKGEEPSRTHRVRKMQQQLISQPPCRRIDLALVHTDFEPADFVTQLPIRKRESTANKDSAILGLRDREPDAL
jgi:hypothetical protein